MTAEDTSAAGRGPEPSWGVCPGCGSAEVAESVSPSGHSLWHCRCGAVGGGCGIAADLDEVADDLLEALGLRGTIAEFPVALRGVPGVSASGYDIPAALEALAGILAERGLGMTCGRGTGLGPALGTAATIWVWRRP